MAATTSSPATRTCRSRAREHTLLLNAEAVAAGARTDLDGLGGAKNAREEKLAARKKAQTSPEEIRQHMEMERLYRQQVLKEQPTIQIQGLRTWRKQDALHCFSSAVVRRSH